MKGGKIIALSAISSAFTLIFLVFGAYFSAFDLSCLFMASICMMVPLSKDSVKGMLLAYLSSTILALIFSAGKFYLAVLFGVFFGLYPLVNYYQLKKNKPFSIITLLKGVWFVLTLYLMVFLFKIFTAPNPIIDKYLPILVLIGGSLVFIVFDFIMMRFQILS